jgi:hypothetical protein
VNNNATKDGGAQQPAPHQDCDERAAWISGMRALLDMLEADPEIRLPHGANKAVAFYVGNTAAAERITAHLSGVRAEDHPERIFSHSTLGSLAGLQVVVHTGVMAGVTT